MAMFVLVLWLIGKAHCSLVDLSHVVDENTLNWPINGYQQYNLTTLATLDEGGYFYISKDISMTEHLGTHMDAPHHFGKINWDLSEIPLVNLVAQVVKLDVRAKCEENRDYGVTVDDLREWEEQYGSVPNGAIILIETGWGDKYPNMEEYYGSSIDIKDSDMNYTQWSTEIHFPGVSAELAMELVTNYTIVGVGVDTASLDPAVNSNFPVHFTLQMQNKYGLENLCCLDEVPAAGATLMAFPPKIKGGSGLTTRVVVDTDSSYIYKLNSTPSLYLSGWLCLVLLSLWVFGDIV